MFVLDTRLIVTCEGGLTAHCVLGIHSGDPEQVGTLQRWQYHLASLTCFLLWTEMLFLVGKLPRFGLYVQMFW